MKYSNGIIVVFLCYFLLSSLLFLPTSFLAPPFPNCHPFLSLSCFFPFTFVHSCPFFSFYIIFLALSFLSISFSFLPLPFLFPFIPVSLYSFSLNYIRSGKQFPDLAPRIKSFIKTRGVYFCRVCNHLQHADTHSLTIVSI